MACKQDEKIEGCFQQIIIQLHHKDGNKKHNHIENLEMLCPNCHTQTDNWGNKMAVIS